MDNSKPNKYQPMSEQCELFLKYALEHWDEKPVALDDACDLVCEFKRKGIGNRKNFVSVFGTKFLGDMEEPGDFADFWADLEHELNEMESNLGDHCPWLVTILGIAWVKGWENVRTQPLSEKEKAEQVEKWNKGTWGKEEILAAAEADAKSEKDDDDEPEVFQDEDEIDAELEEVA